MSAEPPRLYRLIAAADWARAKATGAVPSREIDRRDGYLHLSTGRQVLETARLHFQGQTDLLALEVDPAMADGDIEFEPSRGGDLFPHLYGALPAAAVKRARRLRLKPDGGFDFGDDA